MDGIQQGIQQGYPGVAQFAPQGLFGNLAGGPLGGMIGSGIPGLFGQQNVGRQMGQVTNGMGGVFSPYNAVDPVTAAYLQQAQQAQQGQLARTQLNPSRVNSARSAGWRIRSIASAVDPITQQVQQLAQLAQLVHLLAQQVQITQLAQQAQQAQSAQHGLIGACRRPIRRTARSRWIRIALAGPPGLLKTETRAIRFLEVEGALASFFHNHLTELKRSKAGCQTKPNNKVPTSRARAGRALHRAQRAALLEQLRPGKCYESTRDNSSSRHAEWMA